ncbi:hypothetical protein YC2023_022875 [Brassica napus]
MSSSANNPPLTEPIMAAHPSPHFIRHAFIFQTRLRFKIVRDGLTFTEIGLG